MSPGKGAREGSASCWRSAAMNEEEGDEGRKNGCLRVVTLSLSGILVCSSVVLMSFGAFLLKTWLAGPSTSKEAVPNYIWLILGFGAASCVANVLGCFGTCCRSLCLLSWSASISDMILFWQVLLAALLFLHPASVDTQICPPDDSACLAEVDSLFTDPTTHAGPVVATVCGVQLIALISLTCFRNKTYQQRVQAQIDKAVAAALRRSGSCLCLRIETCDWTIVDCSFRVLGRCQFRLWPALQVSSVLDSRCVSACLCGGRMY